MDVFEHLTLIMIVRREIINYALKHKRFELMGHGKLDKILLREEAASRVTG